MGWDKSMLHSFFWEYNRRSPGGSHGPALLYFKNPGSKNRPFRRRKKDIIEALQ